MQTIAYLRKSKTLPGSAHVSWAVQEAAIRELAARHGDEPEMLSDWNRSGKATANRPGYLRLRTMVEERAVSVVYAYSLSRLSRSLLELLDLLRLCEASGVTIRTARDGDVDYSTPIGRLYVTIVAAVAAFERELDSERARDRVAAQRARGDRLGRLPYGARAGDDVAAVVGAYEEAGTLLGAARILNAAGLKSHLGRSWGQRSIRHVLERAGAYPHGPGRRGRPMRSDALLAGLLVCACGQVLTPIRPRRGTLARYRCSAALLHVGHPPLHSVREVDVLPDVQAEAALVRAPETMPGDDGRRRSELAEQRRRVVDAYVEGLYEKADRDERLAAIDEQERQLGARQVEVLAAIDWQRASPGTINAVLRTMWSAVRLDAGMRVVGFDWLVPGLRRSGARRTGPRPRGRRTGRQSAPSPRRHGKAPLPD